MTDIQAATKAFASLVETMHTLRAPGGCPWDAEQTHESLEPYLVEEAYETLDAIARNNDEDLCDELGDVLLQVVFHAELAAERSAFTVAEVADAIRQKLIRRHPHVFADTVVSSSQEVAVNWQRIKREERASKSASASENPGILDGVPRRMPGLLRAHRLGGKAATVGFDWNEAKDVTRKIREELSEIEEALAGDKPERVAEEVGDLLFATVNLARKLGVQSETAIHGTLDRFARRFTTMERTLHEQGRTIEDADDGELDTLWREAKAQDREDRA